MTKPSATIWTMLRSLLARLGESSCRCQCVGTIDKVWLPKDALLDKYAGMQDGEYASASDVCVSEFGAKRAEI